MGFMWDESALKNKPSKYYGILECWSSKVPWVTANDPRDFYTIKIPVRFQTFCCLTFVRAFSRVLKMTVHVAFQPSCCLTFVRAFSSWMTVMIRIFSFRFYFSILIWHLLQSCGCGSAWIWIILGSWIRIRTNVKKQDPDPHLSEKAEALVGHFGELGGANLAKSEW